MSTRSPKATESLAASLAAYRENRINRQVVVLLVVATAVSGFVSNLVAQEVAGQEPVAEIAVIQKTAPVDREAQFKIPATNDGLPGVGPIRRYGWFERLWENRRSAWANQVEQDQGAVVFFGDSITQGWNDDFQGYFPDLKKANRGISGDTTRGMLLRLQDDVLSLKPRCIVMLMGTNDLEEEATPEQVVENFKLIVAGIQSAQPDMPIVVCEVFPSSETKSRPATSIKRVNELYRQAVAGNANVTVIDTWTLFANEKGDARIEEFPDLLHPNEIGYRKWANAIRPIFATLGLIEKGPTAFEVEPGFRLLFNRRDLTGWCQRPTTEQEKAQRARWQKNNPAAPPWPIIEARVDLAGETQTADGRYRAIADRLVVTTPSEGRRIQQLWTTEEFAEDFELRLEFRATPNADSGVFLRGKQLQCRDFPLAGPYTELKNYKPGGWNELVVKVSGQTAHCVCNGETLEEAFEIPASGPIGLEGDRGQIEYRHIRIRTQ